MTVKDTWTFVGTFLSHVLAATLCFLVIILTAAGLSALMDWLDRCGVDPLVCWCGSTVARLLVVLDVVVFVLWVILGAYYTARKLIWGEAKGQGTNHGHDDKSANTDDRLPSMRQAAEESVTALLSPLAGDRSKPAKPLWEACAKAALASVRLYFLPVVLLWRMLGWTGCVLIAVSILLFAAGMAHVFPDYKTPPGRPLLLFGVFVVWLTCLLLVLRVTRGAGGARPSWVAGGAVVVGTALVAASFLILQPTPVVVSDQARLESQLNDLAASLKKMEGSLTGASDRLAAAEASGPPQSM